MRILKAVVAVSPYFSSCLSRKLSTQPAVARRMTAVSPLSLADQLRQDRLFVYTTPDDSHIVLRLRFQGSPSTGTLKKERQFTFRRAKDESLGRTLERMSQNLTSKITSRLSKKKMKKSTGEAVETSPSEEANGVAVSLRRNGVEIPGETLNGSVWTSEDRFVVESTEFVPCVNPPMITSGKITKQILPEFPVDVTLECEGVDEERSIYVWLKQKTGKRSVELFSEDYVKNSDGQEIPAEILIDHMKNLLPHPQHIWEVVSLDRDWIPHSEHIGLFIALLCFPIKDDIAGEPFVVVAKNPIGSPLPEPVPYKRRHGSCQQNAGPNRFRIISYNLLADLYADQEFSLKELFPYCSPECIKGEYRRQLTLQEITGYNADIVCTQELDTKLFNSYYSKQMRRKGYEGVFRQKQGKAHEGIGTFYRADKFRMLGQYDINISTQLFENPLNQDLADAINSKEKLKEVLMARTNPLQVSHLQDVSVPTRSLLVANTHLWFRPQFPRVRLLQMAVSLRHMHSVMEEIVKSGSACPAVILCGDFNSSTGWGVHHLLNKGSVPVDFPEWKMFCTEEDEYIEVALEHPFKLLNACGDLQYTNYTVGFKAAIDWIYVDSQQLESRFVIPMPTEEELSRYTAIPSPVFPSDHIAIGCDLEWKS